MRRIIISVVIAALLLSLVSCSDGSDDGLVSGDTPSGSDVSIITALVSSDTTDAELPDQSEITEQTDILDIEKPAELLTHAEAVLSEVSYDVSECFELYEAEDGEMDGYCAVMSSREGYSGTGYVTGLSLPDSSLTVTASIPSAQHYSVTICAASSEPVEGVLYVDGLARGIFTLSGTGEFESVKFDGIYLSPDTAAIGISDLTGECDIDFFLVENSDIMSRVDYDISGVLSNPSPTESAEKLYKYLCGIYGEAVLTAQQCSQGSNAELYAIASVTGKYPAIRFGELSGYSSGYDTGDIELAMGYAAESGIIGYSWYWAMDGSIYAEQSGFDLSNAVTTHDVAHMSLEKVVELKLAQGVSDECVKIIEGIDLIAEQLKRLSDLDIPLLFRPLPEAGNGEFWWGSDYDSYLWLYKLMYTRLTEYHGLDNIIWIWNAQSADWYVGDEYCDIISLDVYDFTLGAWDNQSHITAFTRLMGIASDKPAAISECNVLIGPANIVKDNAYWLFASVWSGEYCLDEDGSLCETAMSEQEWILFYNCSETLTLDELP